MKKKSIKKLDKKRWFIIENDTYKQDILCCFNMTSEEVLKILKKKHSKLTEEDIELLNDKDFQKNSVDGTMYKLEQGFVISLKWHKDSFRANLCVAMHEIMHITHYILRDLRIPLKENTEEAYTYLFTSLMEKFLFKLY